MALGTKDVPGTGAYVEASALTLDELLDACFGFYDEYKSSHGASAAAVERLINAIEGYQRAAHK